MIWNHVLVRKWSLVKTFAQRSTDPLALAGWPTFEIQGIQLLAVEGVVPIETSSDGYKGCKHLLSLLETILEMAIKTATARISVHCQLLIRRKGMHPTAYLWPAPEGHHSLPLELSNIHPVQLHGSHWLAGFLT